MSDADTLGNDLYRHLIWWLHESQPVATAFTEGHSYRWVMDITWLNACRRMAVQRNGGRSLSYVNAERMAADAEYLLGLPIEVREHDDRPGWIWRVPHLELEHAS